MRRIASLVCVAALCGSCATLRPYLEDVADRVDTIEVLKCAARPTRDLKAECLGREALSVGAEEALDRAGSLANEAIESSSELSDDEKKALAKELLKALDALAAELED